MFKWIMRERDPERGDEIVDLSAGPFRSKTNYTLLGRVIALRRILNWLDVSRKAA